MKSKLCIIGIDGLVWNIAAEEGCAPALASIAEHGILRPLDMEVPTVSGPGWSSLLTGTTHAEHGVVDNNFSGHRLANHPDILSRLAENPSVTTMAAGSWLPLVDPHGIGPVIRSRPQHVAAGRHRIIMGDGSAEGFAVVDARVADEAVQAIASDPVDAAFIYFCGVDEAGHSDGSASPAYRRSIGVIDSYVARILEVIDNRVAIHGESWLVVVTTDHGHLAAGGHGGSAAIERESFMLVNGRGRANPTVVAQVAPHELSKILLDDLVSA